MGVITRGSNPKLLWPGLNAVWGLAYNEYPEEWRQCYELATSTQTYEEDVAMTGFGLAPMKGEGEGLQYDETKQSFVSRYTHLAYSLGYIITREEMADNLYGKVGTQRTQNLASSMRRTKEIVGANVFNRAFSSSYKGGDGVSLINTAHPIEGGTFSNRLAFDADLSEASLEQMVIDIGEAVDNRGIIIHLRPKKLLIPNALRYDAKRILGNPQRPATADRDINALYQYGDIPTFAINHWLTDSDAWFVLTDCNYGLRHFERQTPKFESDNDFDTKNGKFSGYYRDSFGWTNPRGCWGSAGS